MVLAWLATFIGDLAFVLTLLILASVILSYFMPPYHPVRETVDRFVNPMLNPIRRVVPPIAMFDFSPLILIVLIDVVARILSSILFFFAVR